MGPAARRPRDREPARPQLRGDGATKQLLNKLDVYFIPSLNPDGGHYSFFDDNGQRKNMTNHCGDPDSDRPARPRGVDNNRNYDYGSIFDGYDGASSNCMSELFGTVGTVGAGEPQPGRGWPTTSRTSASR